jgi:predicted ribosome-associated RNA-binding protein Tma20
MAQISGNTIGIDFTSVFTPGVVQAAPPFKTGTTVFGDDGKTYQYAKANASISAGNTAVSITLSSGEYVAAASGGSAENASGVALSSGDFAWFKLD